MVTDPLTLLSTPFAQGNQSLEKSEMSIGDNSCAGMDFPGLNMEFGAGVWNLELKYGI